MATFARNARGLRTSTPLASVRANASCAASSLTKLPKRRLRKLSSHTRWRRKWRSRASPLSTFPLFVTLIARTVSRERIGIIVPGDYNPYRVSHWWMEWYAIVGGNIRRHRGDRDWTIEELAYRAEMDEGYLG